MEKEEIQKIIRDYIKDNLKIKVTNNPIGEKTKIKIEISLNDELIDYDYI